MHFLLSIDKFTKFYINSSVYDQVTGIELLSDSPPQIHENYIEIEIARQLWLVVLIC